MRFHETRAQWEAKERASDKRRAAREARERAARNRAPCAVCGGRMSAPRNGLSTCQGDGFVRCGLVAERAG